MKVNRMGSSMPLAHWYEPSPNEVLFHYTSANAVKAIIQSQSFWLSEYSKMNDPLEFQYAKEVLLELLRERHVQIEQIPRWLAAQFGQAMLLSAPS